jgi:hypothetical protein
MMMWRLTPHFQPTPPPLAPAARLSFVVMRKDGAVEGPRKEVHHETVLHYNNSIGCLRVISHN